MECGDVTPLSFVSLFGGLVDFRNRKAKECGVTSPHSSKIEELVHATPAERRARVEDIVRNALGGVLRLPAEHIDRHRHFGSLGLDSIMSLELRNRLESALQRPLSATLAWNYPTVDALAAHLDRLVAPESRSSACAECHDLRLHERARPHRSKERHTPARVFGNAA